MNITLRKANTLQNLIQAAIKDIKVNVSVEINEFQCVATVLDEAQAALIESDSRRHQLTMALYDIRALIGTANTVSGINTMLAKAAFVDKRIGQLEELVKSPAMTDLGVINGRLDKIRNNPAAERNSFYGVSSNTVSTSVIDQSRIAEFKTQVLNLKKQKQKLNDQILESNIKTEISLSDETVAILQAEELL